MFLSETIWRFRARCRSFSDCFRTRRHVRHTLSARDGAMASSVLVVAHPVSLTVFPLAPACSVVGSVAVTRASPLAPSWSAHTLRSRFGSGQRTWLPVKRPACRLFSFSDNSDSPATRPRSRFFTNCALAWCDRIRTPWCYLNDFRFQNPPLHLELVEGFGRTSTSSARTVIA